MTDDRSLRIDVHLYWPAWLWDRLQRLTRRFSTVKSWITPALQSAILLVGIAILLKLQASRGPSPTPDPHPAPTPAPPAPGPRPVPPPQPQPELMPVPDPDPMPVLPPEASASPLTRAVRDYIQTLPRAFQDLADKVESGELKTKAEAVAFSKKHAASMAAAMDQVFSAGVDQSGKITDAGAIAAPLKATAKALGTTRVRTTSIMPEAF